DLPVEVVVRQIAFTRDQLELRRRHEREQPALLAAHRAVARQDLAELERDLVLHVAAVTATGVRRHGRHYRRYAADGERVAALARAPSAALVYFDGISCPTTAASFDAHATSASRSIPVSMPMPCSM